MAGSPSQVAQVTVTVPHSESGPHCDSATLRMLACQLNSFVLVACAMCASSHHGETCTRAADATSWQRPAGAKESYSGSSSQVWERPALILV